MTTNSGERDVTLMACPNCGKPMRPSKGCDNCASGEPAMPPEAWLAEKAGKKTMFGLFANWRANEWAYYSQGRGVPIPIAPYSDAEAWTILTWLAKADIRVEFMLEARGPRFYVRVCPRIWNTIDREVPVEGIATDPKAALAAAVAKLREGA